MTDKEKMTHILAEAMYGYSDDASTRYACNEDQYTNCEVQAANLLASFPVACAALIAAKHEMVL